MVAIAERNISVKLGAKVDSYVAAMKRAERETTNFSRSTQRNLTRVGSQMQKVGRRMTMAVTLPIAAGATASVKAAVDWESAWAGVTKTVDGTAEQMSALEQALRNMTGELPATHGEIAAVAAAAGQLGVGVTDIEAFTRVMLDLGETTNLSADEAATALARFMNIMGTSQGDVSNLGSSIVDLGNNFETTEAEITEMATRLAAAGRQAGLSESDVLAFAAALTSVGVNAEAGGTAFSKVFDNINTAVIDGGEKLDEFARIAGVSTAEFRRAFEEDSAAAIALFIDGIGRMAAQGESTTGVLKDLGLGNERTRRAVLSLGQAEGLLTDALVRGETAWAENTALAEEAGQRYETTAAQFEVVRNKVVDLGIDIGRMLLPVIEMAVDFAGDLAGAFQALPAPIQAIALAFGGLAAAAGPALFIAGSLIRNFVTLQAHSALLKGSISKAAGAFGLLTAAVVIGFAVYQQFTESQRRTEENTRRAVDALDDEFFALLAAAEAAAVTEGEINGVALANEALARTISGSNEALSDALAALNIDASQTLDVLAMLGDEGENTVGVIDFLARSFGLTAEQADFVARKTDNLADPVAVLSEEYIALGTSLGITEEQFDALLPALSQFLRAAEESDVQQIARDFLDAEVKLKGYEDSLVSAAEANLGFNRQTGDALAVYREWARLVAELTPEQRDAAGITEEMATAIAGAGRAIDDAVGPTDDLTESLDDAALAAESITSKLENAHGALDLFQLQVESSRAQADLLGQAFEILLGPTDNLRDSAADVHGTLRTLADELEHTNVVVDNSGTHFDFATEAGRRNNQMLQDVRDAIFDHGAALMATGLSAQDATNDILSNTESLKEQMRQAGFTEEEIQQLITAYGLTPRHVQTAIQLQGDLAARAIIDRYVGMLDLIPQGDREAIETQIATLIDQGKFDTANALLNSIALGREMLLTVRVSAPARISYDSSTGSYVQAGRQLFAHGGFVDRETDATLGEGGRRELILPLTRPADLKDLLANPLSAPIWAAMGDLTGGRPNRSFELNQTVEVTSADPLGIARETARAADDVVWRARVLAGAA